MILYILTILTGVGTCLMAFSFLPTEIASLLIQNNKALFIIGGLVAAISFIEFVRRYPEKSVQKESV